MSKDNLEENENIIVHSDTILDEGDVIENNVWRQVKIEEDPDWEEWHIYGTVTETREDPPRVYEVLAKVWLSSSGKYMSSVTELETGTHAIGRCKTCKSIDEVKETVVDDILDLVK